MPLTAMTEADGVKRIIDITTHPYPRVALAGIDLFCPECRAKMHVRHTLAVRAHFAHNPRPGAPFCSLASGGESEEHMLAKVEVRKYLLGHPIYKGCKVLFEYDVEGVRRADVMAVFAPGVMEAHEIQLSSIPLDDFVKRTSDYNKRGIDVFWWLGEKIHDDVKTWMLGNMGQFGCVSTKRVVEHHRGQH